MVQLTINGKQIEAPEGITVLAAAKRNGIDIPTLCAQKELTPFGGCRLCIVEVQGFRVPIAACTLPVSNGMVVNTETETLQKSRKFILSMLFSERNHFCPFCQKSGGDCDLQNAAYHEGMTHWPMQPVWTDFPVDASHPYFVLDNSRCILCRRCVRACGELVGNFTLAVAERGASSLIVADANVPLGSSSCIKCGTCVQSCPTGALIDRTSAYQGHERAMTQVKTVCVGCSVGCGLNLFVHDNRIVRIDGDWEAGVSHGLLCELGRYDPMQDRRDRITTPFLRRDGKLQVASWEDALGAITEKLTPLAGRGQAELAAIASSRLSVEALAAFQDLFVRGFQAGMVTSTEEGMTTAVLAAVAQEKGSFEGRLDVLRNADTVLCIGANIGMTHMVAGFMVKRALPMGMHLIQVSPESGPLDALANVTLNTHPGSDLALIEGLQAVIVKEGLGRSPLPMPDADARLAEAVQASGIQADILEHTARILAHSVSPVILFGKGITAQRDRKLVEALISLATLIGACDNERVGLLSVKGEANSQAAVLFGLDGQFTLQGRPAVFVALGDDHAPKRLVQKLEQASWLAVQATYASALTEKADVILPVGVWSEQAGHYINLEGRVQKAEKVIEPPAGVRSNIGVLAEIATRLEMPIQEDWQERVHTRKSSVVLHAG